MMIDAKKLLNDTIFNSLHAPYITKQDVLNAIDAQKQRNSRKMLPCKCGGKRREHWYSPDSEFPEGLKCMKCGFEVWGKSATDVIHRWNRMMECMTMSAMPEEGNNAAD